MALVQTQTQNQITDVEIVHCLVEIVESTVEVITQVRGEEEGGVSCTDGTKNKYTYIRVLAVTRDRIEKC